MIIAVYNILVSRRISQRIILPVGKEIRQMFFRQVVFPFSLRKKGGLQQGRLAKCPAGTERMLVFRCSDYPQLSGIIGFRVRCRSLSVCRIDRFQITVYLNSRIQRCQFFDRSKLLFFFLFCQRTSFDIADFFGYTFFSVLEILMILKFLSRLKAFCLIFCSKF